MNEQGGEYGNNGGGDPIFGYETFGDFGAATSLTYRDKPGSGGFTYRQYSDGSIEIVGAPKGYEYSIGRKYAPNNTRDPKDPWTAITNEIGVFPGSGAGAASSGAGGTEDKKKGTQALEAASAFAMGLFDKMTGTGSQPAAAAAYPVATVEPAKTNWTPWIIGGGIAFLLLGGLTIWAMRSPQQEG